MNIMKRLNKVYDSSHEIYFDDNSKIILMSDCHRGDGNWTDNFSKNQNIFFGALSYYYRENYTYIELGDGDELWEVPKYYDIIQEHSDVFWLMSKFYKDNRLYMIYGNHDMDKQDPKFVKDNLHYFFKEAKNKYIERCITGIEIKGGNIMLVKWSVKINDQGFLYIGKNILAGPRNLGEY